MKQPEIKKYKGPELRKRRVLISFCVRIWDDQPARLATVAKIEQRRLKEQGIDRKLTVSDMLRSAIDAFCEERIQGPPLE